MMDIPINSQTTHRCRGCSRPAAPGDERCAYCGGELRPAGSKSLFTKVKRALGIELSSDIEAIDLADTGYFFTKQEIEYLLRMENLVVLSLDDIPDPNTMFFNSKRVYKPLGRSGS